MARRKIDCQFEKFPYNEDYYAHLRLREDERFDEYYFQARSPQISFRKGLLKSLKELSDALGLEPTTFHLSVHLLDIFMDCHEIDQHQLMLTASSCLLIAAKYVDVDSNVPKFSRLQFLTNYNNSLHEYKIMERMILTFWKWDLNFSTCLHFLDYYLSCDILKCAEGLHLNSLQSFKCQAIGLANLTLSETIFLYFKSSIIAASCIAAVRIQFRLTPTWPSDMEKMTGYSHLDIDQCLQHMLQFIPIAKNDCLSVTHLAPSQNGSVSSQEELRADSKWKLKATVTSYNCARTKRRYLVQPRDLKQMYCAM